VSAFAPLACLRELKMFSGYRMETRLLEMLLQEATQGSQLTIFIDCAYGGSDKPYKVSCFGKQTDRQTNKQAVTGGSAQCPECLT
jgi:hypothetical protein